MRIKEIEAEHVRVPLNSPYTFKRGTMTAFESVIVRMTTDNGIVGYGESAPLFRAPNSNPKSIAKMIKGPVTQMLLGSDPFDIEMIVERVLQLAEGNVDVVAGVDLALWDIMGKLLNQPVFKIIGGLCQDPIAVDYTLSAYEPTKMAEAALQVHREGFQGVVVKITGQSLEEDILRVRSVREALPSNCTVRVDCNGAYSSDKAVEFLKAISAIDIELVEDPVPADDIDGFAECAKVGVPISIDERLKTSEDALLLISRRACNIMNIKIANVGGLFLAKRMAAIAKAAGMPVVVGGRTSLELSRCASRHFAASTPGTMGRKHEGPGPASQDLSDDVVDQRTTRQMAGQANGHVNVERAPGLGLNVVWDKVKHYAVQ